MKIFAEVVPDEGTRHFFKNLELGRRVKIEWVLDAFNNKSIQTFISFTSLHHVNYRSHVSYTAHFATNQHWEGGGDYLPTTKQTVIKIITKIKLLGL